MKVLFKVPKTLLSEVRTSLARRHPFAAERVGFLVCRTALLEDTGVLMLAHGLHEVADEDYVDDSSVGATMGSSAIRKALQLSHNQSASMFHVHLHSHRGRPRFSGVDVRETRRFVPDFWNVQPSLPHGAIVLSDDSACGRCWIPGRTDPVEISEFSVVGIPMERI